MIWYFGGASLSATGIISLGVLYAFVDYLTRLFSPITNMVNQLANLEQARVASERVFELLEEKGEAVEEERMPRLKGNVKFDNVSFSYNGKDEVLKIFLLKRNKERQWHLSVILDRKKLHYERTLSVLRV